MNMQHTRSDFNKAVAGQSLERLAADNITLSVALTLIRGQLVTVRHLLREGKAESAVFMLECATENAERALRGKMAPDIKALASMVKDAQGLLTDHMAAVGPSKADTIEALNKLLLGAKASAALAAVGVA